MGDLICSKTTFIIAPDLGDETGYSRSILAKEFRVTPVLRSRRLISAKNRKKTKALFDQVQEGNYCFLVVCDPNRELSAMLNFSRCQVGGDWLKCLTISCQKTVN
ncbi:hypothetical protein TcasGA2_TC008399 [Tribolium castaneum]|uniref:Uncharacterized protein n=1 Tax=Tribolium castaneum TaxID=7070 RepID=D2A1K2_TRICA|nr:hypothetical protein TcasGA2_TC008399 [Tribolium castaneum]